MLAQQRFCHDSTHATEAQEVREARCSSARRACSIRTLQAKIGQLTMECDLLVRYKSGLESAKR
jgi:hypothetical protein